MSAMPDTGTGAVDRALGRAADFLWSMQAPEQPRGVFRFSPYHDVGTWPGVLLSGTYNAIMCLDLLGGLAALRPEERQRVVRFVEGFREPDGTFLIPGMRDGDVFKKSDREETWRYIRFHLTNYSLGALEALDAADPPRLDFLAPFLDGDHLAAWLARRDLRLPWLEGNNIVNLASFLLLKRRTGGPDEARAVDRALSELLDWHARYQEPATGFWGVGQTVSAVQHLHAMAGATHNFHLFYALGAPIPHVEPIVDYCLSLPTAWSTACLDVDAVDILAAFHDREDYRRPEIRVWLAAKLAALLGRQNPDGGFGDSDDGTLQLDGWVGGYAEPQGLSNTFATWFRCIAIALADRVLRPGRRRYHFRRMIGIGHG